MFSRNSEKLEALIGVSTEIRGNIDTKGTLRIDGIFEGNINADWVILGEKASVKGDIESRGIVVGGKIEGNLRAKEIVEIKSKGQVLGDIHTTKLTVIEGGIFDGRSTMIKEGSNIVEFQVKN
ncbi:MAG: polymer-forming cytoskeletal protein [Nitrospirae bacterium]|jgi:cytoskeletal protein CcmA (bactofilin family)|nr:polymer-forming cytoskeletal protein [Nitrospirota bacterium]